MASVASQLIEEVTAHVQRDSLEVAREICTDGAYFLNNLRIYKGIKYNKFYQRCVCVCVYLNTILSIKIA